MALAANLAPVAALIGTWSGAGHGEYPTIDSFDYTETVVFEDVGKPFLVYRQRTMSPDGNPLHTESGFLRVPGPGIVEFVLAQPTGHTELCEGSLETGGDDTDGDAIDLRMTARVQGSATGKSVEAPERTYRLRDGELVTDFAMAAVGQPMTHHLSSVLTRA